jgi:hypothetical protein
MQYILSRNNSRSPLGMIVEICCSFFQLQSCLLVYVFFCYYGEFFNNYCSEVFDKTTGNVC